MPSRYRRVGVVLDPELASALSRSAPQLAAGSEAARVRELALLGAAQLQSNDPRASALAVTDRLLDRLGASSAVGDLLDELTTSAPASGPVETTSDMVAWLRGDDRD